MPARRWFAIMLAALLSLLGPALAPGQDTRASITGQVTDNTQAAIPKATVRATWLATNQTTETTSDESGNYSFAFLPPGLYTVDVTATGFRTLHREDLVLLSDESVRLPLVLDIGNLTDQVSVPADNGQLQTSTASRSYRWQPDQVRALPLLGRQAYSLISLTPGVLFTQEQFSTDAFVNLRGFNYNTKFIINGGREGTNQFLLNGAPVSLLGGWQYSPNVDAIEEFKVLINTYDAQYGRTGGGTVSTTLRSGTNEWHGMLFEYFHNSVFDANTRENNLIGAGKGKHNTHEYGGTIGGPIRKDKDFLFLSYEGFREIVPAPIVSDTPPLDLRDGQHFGEYKIKVYDPKSVRKCKPGTDTPPGVACYGPYIRQLFPGGEIPRSRISPIGQQILALYPAPNGPGLTQNFIASANTADYDYDAPSLHWDHVLSGQDRFSMIAAFVHGHEFSSTNGFPPPADTGNSINQRLDQNYIAEYTHVLSPATVADLRMSFGRFTQFFPTSSDAGSPTAAQLGFLNMPQPPAGFGAAPTISLQSYSSIIGSTYTWSTQNQWDIHPGLIHTQGRHVLHYGFEYVRAAIGSTNTGAANGQFTFNRNWTDQYTRGPRNAKDGNSIGDLLLGIPSSGYVDYNGSYYRTWPYFAFYVQDYWRVAPKLTLNLGLRYDVQIPLSERHNRLDAGFDLSAVNPLSDQIIANWKALKTKWDAANPRSPYPDPPAAIYGGRVFTGPGNAHPYKIDWTDIQPRFGLAWNFAPKTVLRAGFGIFYRTATQLNQSDGFNQRTNYVASLDAGVHASNSTLSGPYSLENPYPDGIFAPTGSSLGFKTSIGRPITFDGTQRPIPRTYEYSVGFQRELPWKTFLDVSYAGSQTVHDSMTALLDNPSYSTYLAGQADPAALNRRVPNPFLPILPANSDLGGVATITVFDLLRPYPAFNGITETTNPWARYRYDSLQLLAEKRIDTGTPGAFTFLLAYTYSKNFADDHRLNPWNLQEKPVHDLSPFDKPHSVALSGLWDLPVGTGRHWLNGRSFLARHLAAGWTVDWVFTYSSGYPVSVPDSVFTCGTYNAQGGQTAAHWFNNDPNCYHDRAQYALRSGSDRFSTIRNPSAPQLHASIEKNFWITDRYALQFRGEAYNVSNTPILGSPVTDPKDPRFGQLPLAQANTPRLIQIAVKLIW